MPDSLQGALSSVDWSANVQAFCSDKVVTSRLEALLQRFAVWAHQLEQSDGEVEAIKFIREARLQGAFTCASLALAMYKPAASSMRTLVECTLYYSYFRTHPAELATLARDASYFVQKSEILDYHKRHTRDFSKREQAVSLLGRLTPWYAEISGVVHGQIPGAWVTSPEISATSHDKKILEQAVASFEIAVGIAEAILLSTVAQDLWATFSIEAKRLLLKGVGGAVKTALGLSLA